MQQAIAKTVSFFNANHNDLHVAKDKDYILTGHLHMSRIVTIWHFGQDSITEYMGERFKTKWGNCLKAFRIYSKEFGNKKDENKRTGKTIFLMLLPNTTI